MSSQPGDGDAVLLVVTDDPLVRQEVRFGLPSGFTARYARDSREAWKDLLQHKPSVVVVDIQTGSAGGYGLAKDMRSRPELSGVPLVMLIERDHDAWLAAQAGAALCIRKPVPTAQLIRQILEVASSS